MRIARFISAVDWVCIAIPLRQFAGKHLEMLDHGPEGHGGEEGEAADNQDYADGEPDE
jgi:hypothetical protein